MDRILEIAGWTIWSFGGAFLLDALWNLQKEKGRGKRIIFCVIAASGLALTYFTSFSKFHLLWILPLRLVGGLIFFGLFALFAFGLAKARERKPEKTTLQGGEFPPFGKLEWDNGDWSGKTRLSAWAGFQSRGGPYGSQDSASPSTGKSFSVTVHPPEGAKVLTPTEAQCRALKHQMDHGEEIVGAVLAALLPHHQAMKKQWELDDEMMPPVSSTEQFRGMIGLSQVHVLSHEKDGMAYVGFEFGCDWEDEHGLGVVLHGSQVVEIEAADVAFSWSPECAQAEANPPATEAR